MVVYRLYLHPLSRYPGPPFARVSGWQNWYHASKGGDRHLWLYQQHQRYGKWSVHALSVPLFILHLGPVVRFTPNAVSINTAAALQDIYGSRKANVVKSDWYRTIQYAEKGTASTFTAINPKQHAQKRRLLSHAFSENALRDMEPQVVDHVRKWCNHLGKGATKGDWSEGRNMSTWADYLTFDVLSDLSFGKSLEISEKEDNRFIMDLLLKTVHAAYDVCKDSSWSL